MTDRDLVTPFKGFIATQIFLLIKATTMSLLTKLSFFICALAATTPVNFYTDDYHENEKNRWEVHMGALELLPDGGEKTFKVRFSETPRPVFIGVYTDTGPTRLEVYDPSGKLVVERNVGQNGWSQRNGVVSIAPQKRGDEYTIKVQGIGRTYCFTQARLIKTK